MQAAHSFSTVGKQSAKLSNRVAWHQPAPRKNNSSKQSPSLSLSSRGVYSTVVPCAPLLSRSRSVGAQAPRHPAGAHRTLLAPFKNLPAFPNRTNLRPWLLLDLWWAWVSPTGVAICSIFSPFGAREKREKISHLLTADILV